MDFEDQLVTINIGTVLEKKINDSGKEENCRKSFVHSGTQCGHAVLHTRQIARQNLHKTLSTGTTPLKNCMFITSCRSSVKH